MLVYLYTRFRTYFRHSRPLPPDPLFILKIPNIGKADNNDNGNPFQGFHQLLFVVLLISISYSRPSSSYFPSSNKSRSTEYSLGWIFRLIDEKILLSSIFPILLVSYWVYMGQITAIDAAMTHSLRVCLTIPLPCSYSITPPLLFVNHTTLTLPIRVNNAGIPRKSVSSSLGFTFKILSTPGLSPSQNAPNSSILWHRRDRELQRRSRAHRSDFCTRSDVDCR